MGTIGQLRRVEDRLIKDLEKTTIPFLSMGKKYGVRKQAVLGFCNREGNQLGARENKRENCLICHRLIRFAKKPHSDFISSHTIKEQLGLSQGQFLYHLGILRKKGLISQKFGRLHCRKAERAYQIYFKNKLPVRAIGR